VRPPGGIVRALPPAGPVHPQGEIVRDLSPARPSLPPREIVPGPPEASAPVPPPGETVRALLPGEAVPAQPSGERVPARPPGETVLAPPLARAAPRPEETVPAPRPGMTARGPGTTARTRRARLRRPALRAVRPPPSSQQEDAHGHRPAAAAGRKGDAPGHILEAHAGATRKGDAPAHPRRVAPEHARERSPLAAEQPGPAEVLPDPSRQVPAAAGAPSAGPPAPIVERTRVGQRRRARCVTLTVDRRRRVGRRADRDGERRTAARGTGPLRMRAAQPRAVGRAGLGRSPRPGGHRRGRPGRRRVRRPPGLVPPGPTGWPRAPHHPAVTGASRCGSTRR
jgi:hypothetical protein